MVTIPSHELATRDLLEKLSKGQNSMCEYGKQFKSYCDQLAVMNKPLNDIYKSHWFINGLRSAFTSFAIA